MGYDRDDSFPFDFELNGIQFGSKSKAKLSRRSYPIQFERKCKYSFLREGQLAGKNYGRVGLSKASPRLAGLEANKPGLCPN